MKTIYCSEAEHTIAERQQIVTRRNKQYVRVQKDMTDLYVQKRTYTAPPNKRKRIKMTS